MVAATQTVVVAAATQTKQKSLSKTLRLFLLSDSHQGLHEFMEFQQTVGAFDTGYFVVLLHIVGLDATMPDEERHGLADVDAHLDGR